MKTSTSALIASAILSTAATYVCANNLDVVNDIGYRPVVVINAPAGTQLTREEVKAQFLAAQKNGDLIVGQNNETARELDPRLYPAQPTATPSKSHQQVRDEFIAAQKAGDLIIGRNGETARELNPKAYPANNAIMDEHMEHSVTTRRQVRAADRSYYGI